MTNDMTTGSPVKLILKFMIPMCLGNIFQQFYNIADSIVAGQFLGVNALAAIGSTGSLIFFVTGWLNGLTSGFSIWVAQWFGAKRLDRMRHFIAMSIYVCLFFVVVMTAGLLVLNEPILRLMNAPQELMGDISKYMAIIYAGLLVTCAYNAFSAVLRALGDSRSPLYFLIVSAVLNVVLDIGFIVLFHMGVEGCAYATVIAQGCSAVWVMKFLTGRRAILRLRLEYLRLSAARVRKIIALGLSGFFMNLTNSLVQIVCNATLQSYGGDLYVGVMTIINSLREVFTMPVQGLSNGSQPVTSFNYGAGQYSRVCASIRFTMGVAVACTAVFWAAAMVFPGPLIQIFSREPDVVEAGIPAMRIYFCMFIPMSLQMASQGIVVSLGRSKQAVFFSLLRKAIINAPLTVILPIWMGTTGVFTAEAVSQLLGGLASSITMYFTVYRPYRLRPDKLREAAP